MTRKGVRSAVPEELQKKIDNPITFIYLEVDSAESPTNSADGYEAITLIEVCDALIQARNDDLLDPSQAFLAVQAEIIVRSAAKVGIVALIDEATGATYILGQAIADAKMVRIEPLKQEE